MIKYEQSKYINKNNIINEFKLNALKKLMVEKTKNNGNDAFSCYNSGSINFYVTSLSLFS